MAEPSRAVVGDVLGERYILRSHAWTSALGPVWRARDKTLDRTVLVQFLDPDLARDRTVVRAFTKAASRVAQVTDASVLQVLDIGEDPPFAVLELAGGGRLSERLATGRAMEIPHASRVALAVARGLEALHARGVWHGSLSAETVLLDAEGRAKIFAVGTTETMAAAGKQGTDAGGPAGYRPPERDPLPQDADRWALAALLYQMVTGRAPDPTPVPARTVKRTLPAEIDHLLRRALAAEQTLRPTLDEFEGALAPFARVLPSDARAPRFAASEFRWLAPAIVIVGLAIAALTFGVKIAADIARRRDARPAPAATASRPAGGDLEIADASDFDPPPGNGEEHADRVDLAVDGDPTTSWATVGYRSGNVGGKPGVGLLLDLGEQRSLSRALVSTEFRGWAGEIRVANEPGERADDFRVAASFSAEQDTTTISLPAGTRARYVLVWVTRLVEDRADDEFPWRATVSEVELFA